MTFEDFLLSCAKREDGTYPYGYDTTRPRDFMCLGTTPAHLEKVWNAAIEAARLSISPAFQWADRDEIAEEADILIASLLTSK
jgi:hypothetical protein